MKISDIEALISASETLPVKAKKVKQTKNLSANAFSQTFKRKDRKTGKREICTPFSVTFCLASAYEKALQEKLNFVPISFIIEFARLCELDLRMQNRSEIEQIIAQTCEAQKTVPIIASYHDSVKIGKKTHPIKNLVIKDEYKDKLLACL